MKTFFCKYYEPYYVKFEKLKILQILTDEKNFEVIIEELKEYSMDLEVEFSREALRMLGVITLKIPSSIFKVTLILLEILQVSLE